MLLSPYSNLIIRLYFLSSCCSNRSLFLCNYLPVEAPCQRTRFSKEKNKTHTTCDCPKMGGACPAGRLSLFFFHPDSTVRREHQIVEGKFFCHDDGNRVSVCQTGVACGCFLYDVVVVLHHRLFFILLGLTRTAVDDELCYNQQ